MYTLATFYKTKAWLDLRRRLMMERVNEKGELLCERCGKPILRPYDCIGHHKIELTEENVNDIQVSLNPENIELIHLRCHNEEHERFGGFRQEVYIVHGAPCAGKRTCVRMNANPDDLIVDLEAIYQAISLSDLYKHPKRVKPIVFSVRDTILDAVKIRQGLWRNAWIITTKTGLELEKDAELFRARLIHVDTDREECLRRLEEHPNGRDIKEWTGYINDYFERLDMSEGPME